MSSRDGHTERNAPHDLCRRSSSCFETRMTWSSCWRRLDRTLRPSSPCAWEPMMAPPGRIATAVPARLPHGQHLCRRTVRGDLYSRIQHLPWPLLSPCTMRRAAPRASQRWQPPPPPQQHSQPPHTSHQPSHQAPLLHRRRRHIYRLKDIRTHHGTTRQGSKGTLQSSRSRNRSRSRSSPTTSTASCATSPCSSASCESAIN